MFPCFDAYFIRIFLLCYLMLLKVDSLSLNKIKEVKKKHMAALFVAITLFYYLYSQKVSIVLLLIKE